MFVMNHTDIKRFYPFKTIGYNTLIEPSTFTEYCFPDNCPSNQLPVYNIDYVRQQLLREAYGLTEYIKSYKIYREDDINACPVLMSNMDMPKSNRFQNKNLAYGNSSNFHAIP